MKILKANYNKEKKREKQNVRIIWNIDLNQMVL